MSHFAERLKKLRVESDLSMQDLADESDVCKSMICKIERNETQPTLDVAGKLANALGKTLSEMLHIPQVIQAVHLTKNDQAIWEDSQHIIRRNISPVFEGLKIEWLHVECPPAISIPKAAADIPGGEKYILVIKGSLDIKINNKVFHIKKGESFYFESSCAHEFFNPGKESVEYYIVIKHS